MKQKIIISVVFIIGLVIFTYPIISNWFSTQEHHTVISEHNKALAEMTKGEKKREKKKAEEYNQSLNETDVPIEDPFSEDDKLTELNQGYYDVLDVGKTIGQIEIPSIHTELPIYHGVGESILSKGVGHMSNSSFPVGGDGTHTALTAHRGLPSSKLFRDLDKVVKGDLFYVKTLDETLAYKVEDIKIVLPHEMDWLEMKEDKDYVTLITCEPYMINSHRLLVRGERVPYIEEVKVDKEAEENTIKLVIGLLVILFILILIYLFLKKRMKRDSNEEK